MERVITASVVVFSVALAIPGAVPASSASGIAGERGAGYRHPGDAPTRRVPAADTIRGRVTSGEGAPLAGATIRIPELGRSTTTSGDGRFVLPGLPGGTYSLVVERLGYESVVRTVRAVGRTRVEVALRATALPAEPIVVTATGGALDVRSSPLPVSVAERAELTATNAVSLAHTIEALPGVRNLSTGQQIGKPVIRGLSGPRISVLENGLPLEYLSWSDEDGPSVDSRMAETVEVVRGPASVLYGSGAIGGVVNVLPEPLPGTPGAPAEFGGSVELYGASSNAEGGGHLQLEGNAGSLGWRLSGVARSGDNLTTPEGEVGNTGYRAFNGRAAVGLNESWGSLVVRYARHQGDFELLEAGEEPREPLGGEPGASRAGGAILPAPAARGAEEIRSEDEGPLRELRDDRVQATGDFPLSGDLRLEVKGMFQSHFTGEVPPEGGEEEFGGEEPSASLSPALGVRTQEGEEGEEFEFAFRMNTGTGRMLLHQRQGEHANATVGISGQLKDTESQGEIPIIPDGQRSSLGLFALEEVRLDRFRLFAGARFDAQQLEVAPAPDLDVRADERDFSAFTGSLGTSFRAGGGLTLTANVGRAWRAPTLLELYSDGPRIGEFRYEIGDPDIGTESSLNLDAGLRFERGAFRAQVRGYRNEIDDFVFLQPTDEFRGELRVHRYRQADAHLTGLEASAHVEPWPVLELGTRFEAVDGINEETDETLPRMPPARGGLSAELHRRDLDWADRAFVRLEGEAVAEGDPSIAEEAGSEPQTGSGGESETEFGLATDSYALLHLTAGWEGRLGGRSLRLTLRVRNLTNNEYRDFMSRYKQFALAPGRSLSLRLGTSF